MLLFNAGIKDLEMLISFVFCKFIFMWVCFSASLFSSCFSFCHRFCTSAEPLILPLSLHHTFLYLTCLTVFLLLFFFEKLVRDLPSAFPSSFPFLSNLMQSRPATCHGNVWPPLLTTELLSLCTQTKSLCLLRSTQITVCKKAGNWFQHRLKPPLCCPRLETTTSKWSKFNFKAPLRSVDVMWKALIWF